MITPPLPQEEHDALYLSQAMTQKLQATAEAHRVCKSALLERALQLYQTASAAPWGSGASCDLRQIGSLE